MTFAEELNDGIDDQLAEAGEPLSISRQGHVVGEVVGIFLQPGLNADSGEVTTSATEAEFVIKRSAYTPTGEASEPKIGDRITTSAGEIWEVQRTAGQSHWTWYGGTRYAYQIRTTKIPGAS